MVFSLFPHCGERIFNLKKENSGNNTVVSCRKFNKVFSIFPSK